MSTSTIDAPTTAGRADVAFTTTPRLAEPGDHEKFAHYVRKAGLGDATVFGTPVVALCGKTWVPTRDPKKFPVCPTCLEVFESTRVDDKNPGWRGV